MFVLNVLSLLRVFFFSRISHSFKNNPELLTEFA